MQINSLKTKNFRNLKDIEFKVHPNKNVICGKNAQGKTNIIEAIWLFSGAKSFRSAKEKDLIKFNEESAKITLDFIGYGTQKTADIVIDGKNKSFYVNDKKVGSTGSFLRTFNAVVFAPDDLRIVKEEPEFRRRFLDSLISRCDPVYLKTLLRYNKIHAHRNKLLRDYQFNNTLPIYDILPGINEVLFTEAEKIAAYRKEYVALLSKYADRYYFRMSGKQEHLKVKIATQVHRFYRKNFERYQERDIKNCNTHFGPHKDELFFEIDGYMARYFGSQGEQRSIALALKLAEAEIIRIKTGDMPVLLLDDVLSELDPDRQSFVLNYIKRMQVFITCCDASSFSRMKKGQIFYVEDGEIK